MEFLMEIVFLGVLVDVRVCFSFRNFSNDWISMAWLSSKYLA